MIYLGLGSNIGDRLGYLQDAVKELRVLGEITKVSSVYETPPWGKEDQDPFLNACVEMSTDLEPDELLYKIKQIEENLGRQQREHWGPREIDIDILFYDDLHYLSQRLTIPHPLLHERAFVLVPLSEIAPDFKHPVPGISINELLETVKSSDIKKLGKL